MSIIASGSPNINKDSSKQNKAPQFRSFKPQKTQNKRTIMLDMKHDQQFYEETENSNARRAQRPFVDGSQQSIANFVGKSLTYAATINYISPYEKFLNECLNKNRNGYLQDSHHQQRNELISSKIYNWWARDEPWANKMTSDFLDELRDDLLCPNGNNRVETGEMSEKEIAEVEMILGDAVDRMHKTLVDKIARQSHGNYKF